MSKARLPNGSSAHAAQFWDAPTASLPIGDRGPASAPLSAGTRLANQATIAMSGLPILQSHSAEADSVASAMGALLRDPYRLFFPLGIALAWAGVAHWLF